MGSRPDEEIASINATIEKVLEGVRILVVDDVEANRKLVGHMLEKAGAILTYGVDGQEALDRALTEPYDLLLLDMQMPVKAGYTAACELRDRGEWHPIIAMTAHAMAGDREKCLAAGCDEYLTKPIDCHQLIQTCERLLKSPARSMSRPADQQV